MIGNFFENYWLLLFSIQVFIYYLKLIFQKHYLIHIEMSPQMVLDKFSSLYNARNPTFIFFMLLLLFATHMAKYTWIIVRGMIHNN